jgi:NitT/TauT family transport system ATP-binding protein
LLRIQGETRKTVLFVTHDLDEAIYVSDRVVVMGARPGRIKAVIEVPFGRPRTELPELRSHPEFNQIRAQMWDLIRNLPASVPT